MKLVLDVKLVDIHPGSSGLFLLLLSGYRWFLQVFMHHGLSVSVYSSMTAIVLVLYVAYHALSLLSKQHS
jgi:uncharacterized membrane protein